MFRGKARAGRNRRGRVRSSFDTAIVLDRRDRSLAAQVGRRQGRVQFALALKAAASLPAAPAVPPPSGHTAAPLDADGWKGWWPAPPAEPGRDYRIPDPPDSPAPVEPTAEAPFVWRVIGQIGAGQSWSAPALHAALLHADRRDRSGSDRDESAGTEISQTVTTFRVQAADIEAIAGSAGALPEEWDLRSGGDVWRITEALTSWDRNRYIDLKATRSR